MSITVAKTAGFCFGVRRAVELAERQAQANGVIYAYGEIIHNMHEIARLERQGVRTAHTLQEIPDGAKVLILSLIHIFARRAIPAASRFPL